MAIVADLSGNTPTGAALVDAHLGDPGLASRSYAVTTSDSADLPRGTTHGISVDTAGFVKYTGPTGVTSEAYLAAGIIHPIQAKRIWATTVGAIAVGIEAWY